MDFAKQLQPLDQHNLELQGYVRPQRWSNPKPTGRYNLVVVGAGTAGLVAAAGAAGLGAKVALVERGLMGGDCLNVGCVPSKALIRAARQVKAIRDGIKFGVSTGELLVDFPAIMERMRSVRAQLSPHDSAQRFLELGVDVFFGEGYFLRGNAIGVGGQELAFKKAFIATGARATLPPIPGLQEVEYLTNESLFSLTALPRRLVVIGGGPIGCEMAQCFARFGSSVTLIEAGPQLLPQDEEQAAAVVQNALEKDGVRVLLSSTVSRVEGSGESHRLRVTRSSGEENICCEQILLCVGRTPNVEGLGLENVGVAFDEHHGVMVNDFLRTTNRDIYAAGDVCSQFKFTHAADFMSRLAIQNALFMGRERFSNLLIPWCTYTSPEVAHVGVTLKQASELGIELTTYTMPFQAVDRAILDGEEYGYVRVYCRKGTDRILGGTVVAEHAGEMMGEIVMAMKYRLGLKKIASLIHPYPTQSDGFRKLGDQYNRQRLTPFVKSLLACWLRWSR